MKKLLYTLLLGLVVISCTQDDMDADISVLAPAQEIETTLSNDDLMTIVDGILNNLQDIPSSKRGTATLTSRSSDYQVLWVFQDGGKSYTTLLDESNDDLCFGDLEVSAVYLDNSAGDGSEISVESEDGTVSAVVRGDFSAFFSGGSNSLIELTADLQPAAIAGFNDSNVATFSAE